MFLCIDNNLPSQDIYSVELETEDETFRSIACDGILLEIRTFDTTYFGIYSEDYELIKKLSQLYKVEIEKK